MDKQQKPQEEKFKHDNSFLGISQDQQQEIHNIQQVNSSRINNSNSQMNPIINVINYDKPSSEIEKAKAETENNRDAINFLSTHFVPNQIEMDQTNVSRQNSSQSSYDIEDNSRYLDSSYSVTSSSYQYPPTQTTSKLSGFEVIHSITNKLDSNIHRNYPSVIGRQSLWQKPESQSMFDIHKWNDLQGKLKEEYNLVSSESTLKAKLQEELEHSHLQYYKTYIELLELEESARGVKPEDIKQRVLIDNTYKLFKDCHPFAKSLLNTLVQKPKLLAAIIKAQGSVLNEGIKNLIRTLVNTFYENIIEEEVWDQDIMIFIAHIIKFEVEDAKTPEDIKFKSNQVLTQILIEFTQRQDFQKYTKYIFKVTLQHIAKANKIVTNPKKIYEDLKKKQTPSSQTSSHLKSTNANSVNSQIQKDTFQSQNYGEFQVPSSSSTNQIHKYEKILRQYDQAMNTKANVASNNIMKIIGLLEEQKSAKFQPRKATTHKQQTPFANSTIHGQKQENPVHTSFTARDRMQEPLERSQLKFFHDATAPKKGADPVHDKDSQMMNDNVNRILKKNVEILKNLTNYLFDSIFKNIYNIPVPIRITCKIIEMVVKQKFKDISEDSLYTIIQYFLFDCYLIPQFKFPHRLKQVNLINIEKEENLLEVKNLMKNIYRRELFAEQDEVNFKSFNPLINELSTSIKDYFQELLSINEEAVHKIISTQEEQQQEKMKVFCACITLDNVLTLCKMIENKYEEICKLNQQVADNAKRILRIGTDCKVFEDRKDLETQGTHKISHVYALLIDVNMPKELQTDYQKEYTMFYAVTKGMSAEQMIMMKAKNMTLQVLISVEKLENILSFTGHKNIDIIELFKIFEAEDKEESLKFFYQILSFQVVKILEQWECRRVSIMVKQRYLRQLKN